LLAKGKAWDGYDDAAGPIKPAEEEAGRQALTTSTVVMPRFMRGIQYAAASRLQHRSLEYWITRFRG
jgi:hypothetical protein